jgi:N-acyl-D-aspartate/D-glutamate deacylase
MLAERMKSSLGQPVIVEDVTGAAGTIAVGRVVRAAPDGYTLSLGNSQALMDLMEGVEEIPNPVLTAGLTWEWESFPDFMDALERRERAIDIAAQAAHLPMRVYVMGDRAIRREPATADDIAEMRKLTIEALRVGAFAGAATMRCRNPFD